MRNYIVPKIHAQSRDFVLQRENCFVYFDAHKKRTLFSTDKTIENRKMLKIRGFNADPISAHFGITVHITLK